MAAIVSRPQYVKTRFWMSFFGSIPVLCSTVFIALLWWLWFYIWLHYYSTWLYDKTKNWSAHWRRGRQCVLLPWNANRQLVVLQMCMSKLVGWIPNSAIISLWGIALPNVKYAWIIVGRYYDNALLIFCNCEKCWLGDFIIITWYNETLGQRSFHKTLPLSGRSTTSRNKEKIML